MQFYRNILEAIGDTPLVKLNRVTDGARPLVLAKMETFNPGHSVKDRIGLYMVEDAERRGLLSPGGTIVEGTSGNTGVGLAMVAAIKGYRAIFTMPDKMSQEKIRLLRAYGADVVVTPTAVPPEHPESYYSVAARIARETPNAVYPNQYTNQNNPRAHYETTGPEIWRQTEGKITHFVAGMGTGGTISGVGKYLKEQDPDVQVVGVDPEGSILKDYFDSKGKVVKKTFKTYKVEGIGEDIIPTATWFEYIDDVVRIGDAESFEYARRLAREEGMLVGGSAGTAVAGALRYVHEHDLGDDSVVVVLIPDSGERYLSKFYNDDWMRENRFLPDPRTERTTIGRALSVKGGPARLVSVPPTETVRIAIRLWNDPGVSQLPVLDASGAPVGSVHEKDHHTRSGSDPKTQDQPLATPMAPPLPT
ncbi:MAG: cystathionine beta-synthase, partial [Methanobacteriota archaeon]